MVDFIRKDIRKFENAKKSHNFPKFLDTANEMVLLSHAVELLFLERNVSAEDLDSLRQCLEAGIDKVREIRERAPKVEK